jgi:signal transduction histidine kinase
MSSQNEYLFPLSRSFIHDLNSKIGAVRRRIELFRIKRKGPQSEELLSDEYIENFLTKIDKDLEMASNVIQEMRDAFKPSLELVAIPIKEIISSALSGIELPSQITCTISIPENLSDVLATHHITEAFRILLINAVEAIENGGNIDIRADQSQENLLEIYIKDSGIGINPDSQKFVFKPFYTTKKKPKYGPGLFWAKFYLNSISGDIELVFSEAEKGSEFRLKLQLARSDDRRDGG